MTLRIKTLAEYKKHYKRSVKNPEEFWAEQAMTFF
ncbi:MAG: acetyl-coenzyme A synthetase N-terminal domain-containing protein [Saprospiraceae bacterium]